MSAVSIKIFVSIMIYFLHIFPNLLNVFIYCAGTRLFIHLSENIDFELYSGSLVGHFLSLVMCIPHQFEYII